MKMEKILIISIFIIGVIFWSISVFYPFKELKVPEEELENLSLIILKNTKFKDFSINGFSFKYPNWKKIDIDPLLIWPKEIAEKQKTLLYLSNPDGVKMVVTKRELSPEDLTKPYPLILREIFTQERKIMEKEGGLTNLQIVREYFFENGIILESQMTIFGQPQTSISKSIIVKKEDKGFIYSVGISARKQIFEDYRPLADYVINSIRSY